MSEKDDCASKLEEREVVFGIIFPASNEPAKVAQPGGISSCSASIRRVMHLGGFLFPQRMSLWPLLDTTIGKLPDGDLRRLCNELSAASGRALEFYSGSKLAAFLNKTVSEAAPVQKAHRTTIAT
jgi:hypothetical protein